MSLAILPSSPATYNQTSLLSAPSPSKRPKLSLNTTSLPSTFGKKATSLRLETLSATSPTVRNTFSNAHEDELNARAPGSRPKRPTLSNLSTSSITANDIRSSSPATSEHSDTTSSTASSAHSVSTIGSLSASVPYKLAYNITSILANSPIPKVGNQRRTFAQSRPMFPAAKKVAFRAPLTEDITTERYTMKHSDIDSSISTISTLELSPPDSEKPKKMSEGDVHKLNARSKEKKAASPQTGDKRESSDEDDSDTCPATPVAGRKKRSREWVWTLGPVEAASKLSDKQHPEVYGIGAEKGEAT
jgi:hypothetical protein